MPRGRGSSWMAWGCRRQMETDTPARGTGPETLCGDDQPPRGRPSQLALPLEIHQQLQKPARCGAFHGLAAVEIPFQHQLPVSEHVHMPGYMVTHPRHENEAATADARHEMIPPTVTKDKAGGRVPLRGGIGLLRCTVRSVGAIDGGRPSCGPHRLTQVFVRRVREAGNRQLEGHPLSTSGARTGGDCARACCRVWPASQATRARGLRAPTDPGAPSGRARRRVWA